MAVTGQQILAEARRFLGVPYVWGGSTPRGFDCSGLVQYVLGQVGIRAPRTAAQQYAWAQKISEAQLQPGDLIFEQWPGDSGYPGHVVMYAGGGKVIEAPHTGLNVRVRSWSPSETHIVGYGRPKGMAGGTAASGGSSGLSGVLTGGALGGVLGAAASGASSATSAVSQVATTAEELLQGMLWLINPENWVRIIAGVVGFFLAAAGLWALAGAA